MTESLITRVAALTPRQRRLGAATVIGLLVLTFFVWAFRPRPILVDIAEITRGPMSVTVTEEARTRVREVYTLSAPIAGRLARVDAEPGDVVVGGDTVVARLYPADPGFRDARSMAELTSARNVAVAARDAAASELRQAEASLTQAQAAFDRDRQLLERGTIAQARMDATRAARDTARAGVDAARDRLRASEAEQARAEAALIEPAGSNGDRVTSEDECCLVLRAPVDGLVMGLRQESETVLSSGMPILDIGDPDDLEIYSEILSNDAVAIRSGARARIDGWGGPELEGHVTRVEPAAFTKVSALGIEEQRVNVLIDIDSPAEAREGLGHDFRVDVHVETWRGDDVIRVPDAALFRRGDRWGVFVVEGGRAKERELEIGRTNGEVAEVQGGLQNGERVVLYPPDALIEGGRVGERPS